jgi:hypothetical protein
MVGHDFTINPCRHNIFDVFPIDKSDTNMKNVREAIRNARDQWKFGRIVARDGTEITLTEAELNAMESILLDPVERLKAEQFVHQEHRFSQDAEIVQSMHQLEKTQDPMQNVLADIRMALLVVVSRFLPVLEPPPLPDDLPWPVAPGPCEMAFESLETAILRDR